VAGSDDHGGRRIAVAKEAFKRIDELLDVPPLLRTAGFIAHGLEVFADLLFAIAKFFGDLRRGDIFHSLLRELLEVFEINRIALQLVFAEALHETSIR
jgi:hypothetical protein